MESNVMQCNGNQLFMSRSHGNTCQLSLSLSLSLSRSLPSSLRRKVFYVHVRQYAQAGGSDSAWNIGKRAMAPDSNPPEAAAAGSSTSAAKPATTLSESLSSSLPAVLSRLQGSSLQPESQQLLQDTPVLQEWQRATRPSHNVRGAMMKLGSHWGVAQKAKGEKRSPTEVTQGIEGACSRK